MELSSRQIRCVYLDLDLHMRFSALSLSLFSLPHAQRKGENIEALEEGKTISNNENWGARCFLTAKTSPSPPLAPSPPATVEAGSGIESCVGGWTVSQDVRCRTLVGLRQQLWAGLLQIILAVKHRSRRLM